MLPNRQLLTSFPVISDKGTKGKEKFVVDLNNTHTRHFILNLDSFDIPYFLDHQDFRRQS
jgi:hypothetical protein